MAPQTEALAAPEESTELNHVSQPTTLIGQDALARLQQYDSAEFNILQPVVIDPQAEFSGTLAFSVGVEKIDQAKGHTYNDFIFANAEKGDYALSALGLQAIARAAGVKVATEQEAYRRDPETGHVYCRFKATVYMLQPNGQPYEVEAHASNDTATLEEQLAFDYAQDKGKPGSKYFTPGLSGAELATKVQKMVLQRKGKIEERTETEAMNRAMRKAFGLKQTYNASELRKPFVTLRVVERPSVHDARLAIEQGGRAVADLYGNGADPLPTGAGRELPSGSTSASTVDVSEQHPGDSGEKGKAPLSSGTEAVAAEGSARVPDGDGATREEASIPVGSEPNAEPAKDPTFEGGKYAGRTFSQVANEDPAYLALVAAGQGDVKLKAAEVALAMQWFNFYLPTAP